MTTVEIAILAGLLIVAVPVLLQFFRKKGELTRSDLDSRLSETQRQTTEELGKLREGFERLQREEAERSDRVQREVGKAITDTLETRLEALKKSTSDTLATGRESQDKRLDKVELTLRDLITQFKNAQAELQEKLHKTLKTQGEENKNAILTLQERVAKELTELREQQQKASVKLGEEMRASLEKVSKANEEKLEKIRLTVDEKLHETLEKRLGESFKQVSDRLEEVHKGLGEMQTLASGVGDLKRVLTNVRSRGTFGEVQLEALLEQVFTAKQYEKNCITVPGSNERVEFALILPGKDGSDSPVRMPIDSKFPVEARERLEQAIEDGDKDAYVSAQKELGRLLLAEAQKIQSKYVSPPHTTDFALMFIPTEGLYAEVLRVPDLAEKMHAQFHVMPVGPMNLYAILNSLQMGFRTLAIEKRSTEVWKILSAVKTEFGKFGDVLDKVGNHLSNAQKQIDATGVRSRAIERKLRDVEDLPTTETETLLQDAITEPPMLPLDGEEE
jgi:DNA recombination protein RmuC